MSGREVTRVPPGRAGSAPPRVSAGRIPAAGTLSPGGGPPRHAGRAEGVGPALGFARRLPPPTALARPWSWCLQPSEARRCRPASVPAGCCGKCPAISQISPRSRRAGSLAGAEQAHPDAQVGDQPRSSWLQGESDAIARAAWRGLPRSTSTRFITGFRDALDGSRTPFVIRSDGGRGDGHRDPADIDRAHISMALRFRPSAFSPARSDGIAAIGCTSRPSGQRVIAARMYRAFRSAAPSD